MSLVFRQDIELPEAVLRSEFIVLAKVERLSHEDQFFHVRVERVLRGAVAVGAELEIHPAGYQLGQQTAEAMANHGMSVSFVVPCLAGKAPAIKAGASYVFLLTQGPELVAYFSWRGAKDVDAVAALLPKA